MDGQFLYRDALARKKCRDVQMLLRHMVFRGGCDKKLLKNKDQVPKLVQHVIIGSVSLCRIASFTQVFAQTIFLQLGHRLDE